MWTRLTCVVIALGALAGAAVGQYGYQQNAVTVAPVAVVAPAVVQVPAYSVSYTPPADPEFGGLSKRVAALEARVAALEQLLARLQPPQMPPAPPGLNPPAPPAPGKPDPFAPKPNAQAPAQPQATGSGVPAPQAKLPALFSRSCVQCHQEGGKEDGGFAVATRSGAMVSFDDAQIKAILRRIIMPADTKGRMPPKKANHEPASPTEIGEVLAALVAK